MSELHIPEDRIQAQVWPQLNWRTELIFQDMPAWISAGIQGTQRQDD